MENQTAVTTGRRMVHVRAKAPTAVDEAVRVSDNVDELADQERRSQGSSGTCCTAHVVLVV
jgi:hypothetical protein